MAELNFLDIDVWFKQIGGLENVPDEEDMQKLLHMRDYLQKSGKVRNKIVG